jgi:phosphoribosylaminoimidazole-succinocarboxamide synthase
LQQADKLPTTLFTPASKAAAGEHDENISFEIMADTIGADLADDVRRVSLALYNDAARYARTRGIIIADTKFEFGLDTSGNLVLMDEILTPDSSRFWEADTWQPGGSPASYDKQFVRDWLETLDWDKTAPGPELPPAVIEGTLSRYHEAINRLTSQQVNLSSQDPAHQMPPTGSESEEPL